MHPYDRLTAELEKKSTNECDWQVVKEARAEICALRGPDAAEWIVAMLVALIDANIYVYKVAEIAGSVRSALLEIGPSAVDPLISLIKKGEYHGATLAADVLAMIQDDRAVDPLLEALESYPVKFEGNFVNPPGDPFSISLLDALTRLKATRAVPTLIALMENPETNFNGRIEVIRMLGALQDERAIAPIISAFALRHFYEAGSQRVSAREALAQLSPASILPLIAACKDENKHISRGANDSLLLITGDDLALLPKLVLTVSNASAEDLHAALVTLRQVGKKGVKAFCEEMKAHPDTVAGATAVLDFLSRADLLRASSKKQSAQNETLVRPASGSKTPDADELLRGSKEADEPQEDTPKKRRWLRRN